MMLYKRRRIDYTRPVEVYRNLGVGAKYSVQQRTMEGGKNKLLVVAHADEVELTSVRLKVSEQGRQRVIREQRKSVHAKAIGWLVQAPEDRQTRRLTYNPYRYNSFVDCETRQPVYHADYVRLDLGGMHYAEGADD